MQKNEKPMYLPDAIKEMMSVYKKPKGNTGKIKTGDRFGHVGRARPKN